MRDLFKLFDRRYSAVNVNDTAPPTNNSNRTVAEENLHQLQQNGFDQRQRKKSLQASRSLKQGFTIVDSFFNERKGGKRYPKCKSITTHIYFSLLHLSCSFSEFFFLSSFLFVNCEILYLHSDVTSSQGKNSQFVF